MDGYIKVMYESLKTQFELAGEDRDIIFVRQNVEKLLRLYRDAEDQVKHFEEWKGEIREVLSLAATHMGKTEFEGGTISISSPSKRPSYDTNALDELSLSLIATHPDIATLIQNTRKITEVAGSLRIEKPKEKK